jgi:hypothetical protein
MITGHCRCGAVKFSYDAAPRWILNCHCESCRRATSAPMATWICVPLAGFRFTAGKPTHYASSKGVRRGFCGNCGSPLSYENETVPDEIHILAGTLSDPGQVKPTAHVFVEDQLPWFDSADELPRYAKTRRNAEPIRRGPRR